MKYILFLVLMTISEILITTIFIAIYKKSKKHSQLQKIVLILFALLFIWTLSLILQILFQNTNIPPVFFEGLASFGACFLPVFILFLGLIFAKTKIKFHWYYFTFFFIPILSTLIMLTNDKNHLMYHTYSIYTGETIVGEYFPLHSLYSYGCIFLGLAILLFYSIKNSGLFSKQSLFIMLGILIPLITNILRNIRNI